MYCITLLYCSCVWLWDIQRQVSSLYISPVMNHRRSETCCNHRNTIWTLFNCFTLMGVKTGLVSMRCLGENTNYICFNINSLCYKQQQFHRHEMTCKHTMYRVNVNPNVFVSSGELMGNFHNNMYNTPSHLNFSMISQLDIIAGGQQVISNIWLVFPGCIDC